MKRERVLLVDDDPIFLHLMSHALDVDGRELVTASDGFAALAAARTETPDLIILDVKMPGMNGFELIQRLRSEPRFAFVPVIFLTEATDVKSRLKGFHLGADDYLSKDMLLEELSARVTRALQRRGEFASALGEPRVGEGELGIRGTLDQVGLPSVLTILEMEGCTGTLHLRDETTESKAWITLHTGRVQDAGVGNTEALGTPQTVAALLDWSGGAFTFEPGEVDEHDDARESTTSLLMTAACLLDETGRDRTD